MKNPILFATFLLWGATTVFGQITVQNWDFNDDAGTGLANTSNSGTIGTAFDFNFSGEPGEGATDGVGNLIIGYSALSGSSAVTTDFTRKVQTPAWSVSSGTYTLEFRVSDWDLAATDAQNTTDGTTGDREGFKIKIESSTGAQATTTFELNDQDFRTRHSNTTPATSTTNGQYANIPVAANGADLIVRIEGNLDTGFWTTSYNYNGGGFSSIVTDGGGITDISTIIMTVEGGTTSTWAANDFIAIDYLTLEVVPEPSVFALCSGFLAMGWVLYRRRYR